MQSYKIGCTKCGQSSGSTTPPAERGVSLEVNLAQLASAQCCMPRLNCRNSRVKLGERGKKAPPVFSGT